MIWNAEQDIQLRPAEGTSGVSLICVPTSAGCFIGDKMKRIPLSQGQFAIVDADMFDYLNQWKWYARKCRNEWYAARKEHFNGKQHTIYMAREILGLTYGDKHQADHINHFTLDNRRSNLRIVSHQQNQWNQKNSKGYCWHKASKKYLAQIELNNKVIYLGLFHTTEEARDRYLEAKKLYHKI